MKCAVRPLPFLYGFCVIAGCQRKFKSLKRGGTHPRRGEFQSECFQGCADLDGFLDRQRIQWCHAHAAARFIDNKPLSSEQLKGFTGRHVAGLELLGDAILAKRLSRGEISRHNSFPDDPGNSFCNCLSHGKL